MRHLRLILVILALASNVVAQSRLFSETTHYAKRASGITVPQTTGTIVVIFYPTYTPADSANHTLFDISDAATVEFTINKNTSNTITYGWWSGAGCNRFYNSATLPTQNAWNVAAYEWNVATGTSVARMNGADAGGFVDDGTCRFDTSALPARVGNLYSENIDGDARISYVAIWNKMLSAFELACLQSGALPEKVATANLVVAWHVNGVLTHEPNHYTSTFVPLNTISGTSQALGRPLLLRGLAGRVW